MEWRHFQKREREREIVCLVKIDNVCEIEKRENILEGKTSFGFHNILCVLTQVKKEDMLNK